MSRLATGSFAILITVSLGLSACVDIAGEPTLTPVLPAQSFSTPELIPQVTLSPDAPAEPEVSGDDADTPVLPTPPGAETGPTTAETATTAPALATASPTADLATPEVTAEVTAAATVNEEAD